MGSNMGPLNAQKLADLERKMDMSLDDIIKLQKGNSQVRSHKTVAQAAPKVIKGTTYGRPSKQHSRTASKPQTTTGLKKQVTGKASRVAPKIMRNPPASGGGVKKVRHAPVMARPAPVKRNVAQRIVQRARRLTNTVAPKTVRAAGAPTKQPRQQVAPMTIVFNVPNSTAKYLAPKVISQARAPSMSRRMQQQHRTRSSAVNRAVVMQTPPNMLQQAQKRQQSFWPHKQQRQQPQQRRRAPIVARVNINRVHNGGVRKGGLQGRKFQQVARYTGPGRQQQSSQRKQQRAPRYQPLVQTRPGGYSNGFSGRVSGRQPGGKQVPRAPLYNSATAGRSRGTNNRSRRNSRGF